MGIAVQRGARPDLFKWGFWGATAILVLLSAWLDDQFLINRQDPEWGKFATWAFLVPHALAGTAALLLGPFQFSSRLRMARPALHRICGRFYVAACLFAGPTAVVVGLQHHEMSLGVAQASQGALWTLVTGIALFYAMKRRIPAHRLWMMRSYGFCLIFIFGRLPDLDPKFDWNGLPGAAVFWVAGLAALIGPNLILSVRKEMRRL